MANIQINDLNFLSSEEDSIDLCVDEDLFIIGGQTGEVIFTDDEVEVYNGTTHKWEKQ